MNFADALREEGTHTYTENGAEALNTTSNACLDLFSVIGAMRDRSSDDITAKFDAAFEEDPLLALKILFYARDIRGGLGERQVPRVILKWLGMHHPEALKPNLDLIGVFGRYDDLYELVGTQLEKPMWEAMKKQFDEDVDNWSKGNAVSLLAKWIKTADASSPRTRRFGIMTAQNLGYSVYEFKRLVRALRKHIGIVEQLMSANRWSEIKYSEVPSRAMFMHYKAFMNHDSERFSEFMAKAASGEVKVNSATLYPYDIVKSILDGDNSPLLDAQWNQLPNYVSGENNFLVMADTSGSMERCNKLPLASAIGLAIYFAERNKGAYHNLFMTFSNKPKICTVKGTTLRSKVQNVKSAEWGMNTNLEAAFMQVLDVAIKNNIPQKDMVKSLIIISDMEFDAALYNYSTYRMQTWGFYSKIKSLYESAGYVIPNIVFWNVDSAHDTYHVDSEREGTQLVSGHSPATFKHLMDCVGLTPVEAMHLVLDSERYACITVGDI